ncbi:hypothetical protein [Nocardia aurantia]|uniref:DUF2269 domain-containing protein n=1 Tax=Nocardia aurantia TaxID=2585199 RepID=A0A7K0DZK8_9NOCA|nr:hypothetical protein [Nocardia aurantia]MQY31260.1 hypothetical protein [Nocardia aurantia]
MTKFLLAVHVLAVILAIGPVTVAASMFPATARRVAADPARDPAVLDVLHRISRVYAMIGIAVPVFGIATASSLGVLTSAWLIVSIVLTTAAAALLALLILPRQQHILATLPELEVPVAEWRAPAQLAMFTGLFNLLWAAVTVLMIVRPGSTTGA